jgi:hypothetical protein
VGESDLRQLGVKEGAEAALAARVLGQEVAPGGIVTERRRERAAQRLDLGAGRLADAG